MTYLIHYLRQVIEWRLRQHTTDIVEQPPIYPQDIGKDNTVLNNFINHYQPTEAEMIVLTLAIAPHILPGLIDQTIAPFITKSVELPEIGGIRGTNHRGIMPTCETALFILAGVDIAERLALMPLFSAEHFLFKHRILRYDDARPNGEPPLSMRLVLDDEFAELFTTGQVSKPKMSSTFPAQLITTPLEWNDLVLPTETLIQIRDIENWIQYHHTLLNDWGMSRHLKPGYRVLFYGPPGTGKTLTASLLGKFTNRDVFRVDLSLVVSKYIGETEKNLAQLFDKAFAKNWILFFDEADALFGKRTETRDAHDRYANQEVAYLLQRIEEFDGLVILASNLKSNIDTAFARRFQAMIHFPMPNAPERLLLWQKSMPANCLLENNASLDNLANRYELSGAAILNIIQFSSLRALQRGENVLLFRDILEGIRLEYQKEGKIFS
jgi:hypothetical protein